MEGVEGGRAFGCLSGAGLVVGQAGGWRTAEAEVDVQRGNIRTARARRLIFWLPRKKLADLDLPHKSQEECVPRGARKVYPYFEVDESIFGLRAEVCPALALRGTVWATGPLGEEPNPL